MPSPRQMRQMEAMQPQRGDDSSNPLAQLSGLVNLINASQAPQQQQNQFQQEMDFKGLGMEQEWADRKAQFEQREQAEANQQFNQQRSYDLNAEQNEIQRNYYNAQTKAKQDALLAGAKGQQAEGVMDLRKLLMHVASDPRGTGALDLNYLAQMAGGLDMPGLINKNFSPNSLMSPLNLNKTNVNPELGDDERADEIFRRNIQGR